MFNGYYIFQSVVLMFLYVEQDACEFGIAIMLRSWKFKNSIENVKNPGKSCFAVGKEWVNGLAFGSLTWVFKDQLTFPD